MSKILFVTVAFIFSLTTPNICDFVPLVHYDKDIAYSDHCYNDLALCIKVCNAATPSVIPCKRQAEANATANGRATTQSQQSAESRKQAT